MNDDYLSVIGPALIMIIIFSFIAYMRYINFKENSMYAEKGLTKPPEQKNGKGSLRWGILITALGVAFTVGLYPIGYAGGDEYPLRLGPWMLGGFIPLFFGLGLVLMYYLTEKE